MKRTLSIIVSLAVIGILAGCGGFKIRVHEDAFKGARLVEMDMPHGLSDWSFMNLHMTEGKYFKEIKNGKIQELSVTMIFFAGPLVGRFTSEAYMVAGDKRYKFDMKWDDKGDKDKDRYTSGLTLYTIKLGFSGEMAKAILDGNQIGYRFYAGKDPVTIVVTAKELTAIKQWLAAGMN